MAKPIISDLAQLTARREDLVLNVRIKVTKEKEVIGNIQATARTACPYCAAAFDTFDDLKTHVVDVHKTEQLPKPDGLVQLTVNGQNHELMVAPEWTLYQVIHDKLGLTGVKMFCDRGACGSCTVIMEGRPILSCMTLAIECDGKTIETAEGIAEAGHPLVESYIKHHTMQCGYCTPGFITTAKALLDKNPDPTVQEAMKALGGNLCRCGTYPQHPIAVREAARILKEDRSK